MFNSLIFIQIGNFFHQISFIIILLKIFASKNVRGLSLKSSILQCLVFYSRYMNIFWSHTHALPILTKVMYTIIATKMVYLIGFQKPFCLSYQKEHDSVNILYILTPCALLSFVFTPKLAFVETLWMFSVLLEPLAIIPQIWMLQQMARSEGGNVENLTASYMGTLGLYRGCYLIHRTCQKFITGESPTAINLVLLSAVLQTIIYADFLYLWFRANFYSQSMSIPVYEFVL